jgi:hypothetical protein
MERRSFLRAMLGVAAATALPSEVWPFRKIFLPAPQNEFMWPHELAINWSRVDHLDLSYWGKLPYPGELGCFVISDRTAHTIEVMYQQQKPKVDLLVRRMQEAHRELLQKSLS